MNRMKCDSRKGFAVRCDAASAGSFSATSDRLSISVGQQISRGDREQMWDWILIQSSCRSDGSLNTRVLLCNPNWDEPLEIANVESRPDQDVEFMWKNWSEK